MSHSRDVRQAARRVRPDRSPEILAVCVDLLGEVGYERLTMDAVAAQARASKATLYRRWSSKSELVADALQLRTRSDQLAVVDSGNLREDLIGLLKTVRAQFLDQWPLLAGLIHAMRTDPELAVLMRAEIARSKDALRRLLERRIASSGARLVRSTLLQDVIPGQIVSRLLIGDAVNDDYLARLVDEIVLPVLITDDAVWTGDLPSRAFARGKA